MDDYIHYRVRRKTFILHILAYFNVREYLAYFSYF
jgi:hypothetical protein